MYSPPPMEGFSPPPLQMSDFSPPPLSDLSPLTDFPPPINGFSTGGEDTEDDGDYNFVLGDNQYDLTGLSDKINRLELEKMKSLPPREILELQRESKGSGVYPSNEEVSEQSQEESDSNAESSGGASEAKQVTVRTSQVAEDTEPSVDPDLHEHHGEVCEPSDANIEIADCDEVQSSSHSSHENNIETLQVEVEKENVECGESVALESELELPAEDDHEVIDLETTENFPGATEDVGEDEVGWGEFPETTTACDVGSEAWGNFPADEWSLPAGGNLEDRADLEFEESDDDDFGDFGEAADQVQNYEAKEESTFLYDLSQLRKITATLLESVYGLTSGEPAESEEAFQNSLEKTVLSEGEIFEKIDNPASAPALNHQWRDSLTYSSLLLTLGIDSSSNLDGEEWRNSAGRLAPRSAASLMTPGLLTPEALSEKPEPSHQKSSEGDTVTPAQFDWNKSGLTDPLSENGRNLSLLDIEFFTNTSLDSSLSLLKNNNDIIGAKGSTDTTSTQVIEDNNNDGDGGKLYQDHVRREAQNILDGLPLLNFMSSNVLMFPTKSINKLRDK